MKSRSPLKFSTSLTVIGLMMVGLFGLFAARANQDADRSDDEETAEQSHSELIEERMRQALRKPVAINFFQLPLKEVMAYLSKELNVPILIDEKGLEEESITSDEPISISLKEKMELRHAFYWILEPLNLKYSIQKGVILISTAKSSMVARVYNVNSLNEIGIESEQIKDTIEKIVATHHWQDAGGDAAIQPIGKLLVISATEDMHEAIEDLINSLEGSYVESE
jgi:hypothetical protein